LNSPSGGMLMLVCVVTCAGTITDTGYVYVTRCVVIGRNELLSCVPEH